MAQSHTGPGVDSVDTSNGGSNDSGLAGLTRDIRRFNKFMNRESGGFAQRAVSRLRHAYDANIDKTGTAKEPWWIRFIATDAAYRRAAVRQIVASCKTCRDTVAYVLHTLPPELVMVVLGKGAAAFCHIALLASVPTPEMLCDAVPSLFAITEPPSRDLFERAIEAIHSHATYHDRLITMREQWPRPPFVPGSVHARIRHLNISVHLPDDAFFGLRECYPTELYQGVRTVGSISTWKPMLKSCCLEIRCPEPYKNMRS